MPYRRLPNTDAARIRAMRIALEKGREVPPNQMAFSPKMIVKLQRFLPQFENMIMLQRQSYASQNNKSREYAEIIRKARLYLTHFVRVMNMAIFRGDLPAETRAFYGLATNESTVPSLNTENELISWGKRIIEGEEFRIRKGGSPITNPTIAVVKVRYHNFLDAWNFQKTIAKRTLDYTEKNYELRKEADDLIQQIWNEIENTHSTLPEDKRMPASENYGIVYFYRKSELNKPGSPAEAQSTIWP
ncbi:MAG: hypothetical protein RBS38_13855 [Bacteroidales bacterium]|jgi:hypothetical protein|nr:hypothetical protein [Bacteroidales bacterium]